MQYPAHQLAKNDRLTIRRILKVNHAGEYGAIRIYRAQLWLARRLYPDLVDFLTETLGHEISHCQKFQDAMPKRDARPCRVMSLWGQGGYILGGMTALLGRQGIWLCTSAVEETVHQHLVDQLRFLQLKDHELFELIDSIKDEEMHHLDYANDRISIDNAGSRLLRWMIMIITEILIALSTWGESLKMAQQFKPDRQP